MRPSLKILFAVTLPTHKAPYQEVFLAPYVSLLTPKNFTGFLKNITFEKILKTTYLPT